MNQNNKPWQTLIKDYSRFLFDDDENAKSVKEQLEQKYPDVIIKSQKNILFIKNLHCSDSLRMYIVNNGGTAAT